MHPRHSAVIKEGEFLFYISGEILKFKQTLFFIIHIFRRKYMKKYQHFFIPIEVMYFF